MMASDIDPVSKFKALVPRLKESLSKLMEVAALVFYQNSLNDNCSLKSDTALERFDKSLEEFYGICDQIELLLKLAQECNILNTDSMKHTPTPVQYAITKQPDANQIAPPPPPPPDMIPFPQYLQTVKSQIRSAQEIHDLLIECSKRLSEPPTLVSQTQQQQQQLAQNTAAAGSSAVQFGASTAIPQQQQQQLGSGVQATQMPQMTQ